MQILKFNEQQIKALPQGTDDADVRQQRFRAFDKAVWTLFDTVLKQPGPVTDQQVAFLEKLVVSTLMGLPETLAEMLLYTYEIEIGVTVHNSKYGSGWWWNRKYIHHKHAHLHCIFNPYKGGVSAWTDYTDPTKIHHFA